MKKDINKNRCEETVNIYILNKGFTLHRCVRDKHAGMHRYLIYNNKLEEERYKKQK